MSAVSLDVCEGCIRHWFFLGTVCSQVSCFHLHIALIAISSAGPPKKRETETDWKGRTVKMGKGLEHFSGEEGLREMGLFSLGREGLGIFFMYINI